MTSARDDGAPPDVEARTGGGGVLRASLWLLLVVSQTGNAVVSAGDAAPGVHAGLAVLTGLCVAALVVVHLRRRPSKALSGPGSRSTPARGGSAAARDDGSARRSDGR